MRWLLWLNLGLLLFAGVVVVGVGIIRGYLRTGENYYLIMSVVMLTILGVMGCTGFVLLRTRRFAIGYGVIDDEGIEIDLVFEKMLVRWEDILECDATNQLILVKDNVGTRRISLVSLFASTQCYDAFVEFIQGRLRESKGKGVGSL
jgi:hypothetical protein